MATATCTFCGLLCDDLQVEVAAGDLHPVRGACERSAAVFGALGRSGVAQARPRIGGQTATLGDALDAASALLKRSVRPMLGGLDTDVEGMRAAVTLARRIGATADHSGRTSNYRNLHVLQEFGGITTTLAEVRNRADVVLLVGDGWHRRFPRFIERVLAPSDTLFAESLQRRFVLLNAVDAATRAALPPGSDCLELDAPIESLPVLLGMLAALASGRPADPGRLHGLSPDDVRKCVDWIRSAQYSVIVWSAADLEFPHAELAVHALARFVRALNREQRFAALPLAGTDGDLTANAVQTWQTGLSLPARFSNGEVDLDPERHALPRVLARGEADVLVWVSSLGTAAVPNPPGLPRIVLARADRHIDPPPEVFVPVATPGIDASGHLLRTDNVVTLYAKALRDGGLPSVAGVLGGLLDRLGPRPC